MFEQINNTDVLIWAMVSITFLLVYGSIRVSEVILRLLFIVIKNNIFVSVFEAQVKVVKNCIKSIKRTYLSSFIEQLNEIYKLDKNTFCISENHKCEAAPEIMQINIQLYELMLDRAIKESVKEVVIVSLKNYEYVDYSVEDYTELILNEFTKVINQKIRLLWPRFNFSFKITYKERKEFIKSRLPKNPELNPDYIISLQIAGQTKLIYNKAIEFIEKMENDFKKNPLSVIKYTMNLKDDWE